MASNQVVIRYDGRVDISKHWFRLGDHDVEKLLCAALGLNDSATINADVRIIINRKSDAPIISVDGEACELEVSSNANF